MEPNTGHPSALAGFVSTVIDVTCDVELLACARDTVLHEVSGDWVVFVDAAVELQPRWLDALGRDLALAGTRAGVGCSVGSFDEGGLDVAYRRSVLDSLGPFADGVEEWTTDLDMQLQLTCAGFSVERGSRHTA